MKLTPSKLVLAGVISALTLTGCQVDKPDNPEHIRDDNGRALIMHGMNDTSGKYHVANWDLKTYDKMQEWGFNTVRLLFNWDHLEHQPGVFNTPYSCTTFFNVNAANAGPIKTYLECLEDRVDEAHSRGLTVVLDMHQDVWGHHADDGTKLGGNGAPAWAGKIDQPYGLPISSTTVEAFGGSITATGEQWWLANLDINVQSAFVNFWLADEGDHGSLQDHYIEAFVKVAEHFKDHPAVLGVEVMNEPHGGDLWKTMIDGSFEREWLKSFYDRVIARVREVDNDAYIFLDPKSFLVNQGLASTLPPLSDPRSGEPRLVYAPHMYPAMVAINEPVTQSYSDFDRWQMSKWNRNRTDELNANGMPLWTGEFGAPNNLGGAGLTQYYRDVTDLHNYMQGSWIFWGGFAGFPDDDGIPQGDVYSNGWNLFDLATDEDAVALDALVTTYARAIAGDPVEIHYGHDSKEFTLTYTNRAGTTGPTEIFIPETRHYKGGWEIEMSDDSGSWSSEWNANSNLLKVWHNPSASSHTIKIRPSYQQLSMPYMGKCIGVDGAYADAKVRTERCSLKTNQRWRQDNAGMIRNMDNPNLCIDVRGGYIGTHGVDMQLYHCNGGKAQLFSPIADASSQGSNVRLQHKVEHCMNVAYGGTDSQIEVFTCDGSFNQDLKWQAPHHDVFLALKNEATGLCLEGNATNGGNAYTYTCEAQPDQRRWVYNPETQLLHNALKPEFCLDSKGNTQDGQNVGMYRCQNSDNLRWVMTDQGNGKQVLRALNNPEVALKSTATSIHANSFLGDATENAEVVADSQQWSWTARDYRELVFSRNGRCLNVPNANATQYVHLNTENCNYSDAQMWKLDDQGYLRSKLNPNLCVKHPDGGASEGRAIRLWPCLGTAERQKISLDETGNMHPVEVPGNVIEPASNDHDANVYVYEPSETRDASWVWGNSNNSQLFFRMKNKNTGHCIATEGGVPANYTNILQWSCDGGDGQLWYYDEEEGLIRNKNNGNFCLSHPDGWPVNGRNIMHYDCSLGNGNQQWDFDGDVIRSRHNNNQVLDAYGSDINGNIGTWDFHGGSNQRWEMLYQ